MNQILLINKSIGDSSFDLIRQYKRLHPEVKKIGHAGTLDVFAEGLCLLLLGDATKQFDQFQILKKTYIAGVRLGANSTTLDVEGDITTQANAAIPKKADLEAAIAEFPKEYDQAVPSYSAAKQNGQPLYKLARKGEKITPKSKPVSIYSLKLVAYKWPLATVEVTCSSGTYVRQLTYDLFQKLDLQSFLFSLKRTQIGDYTLDKAVSLI